MGIIESVTTKEKKAEKKILFPPDKREKNGKKVAEKQTDHAVKKSWEVEVAKFFHWNGMPT